MEVTSALGARRLPMLVPIETPYASGTLKRIFALFAVPLLTA